jgi:hypothetical protein
MRFSGNGRLKIGNIDCFDRSFFGSSHWMGTPRLSAHFKNHDRLDSQTFFSGRCADHVFNRHGKE